MYTYITWELPALVESTFSSKLIAGKRSISGHSMGGHGAITLALKNPGMYTSVSAFAPISHPTNCPWGVKAFNGYLGSVAAGEAHDASLLIQSYAGPSMKLLVDQGTSDNFLTGDVNQLQPEALKAACSCAHAVLPSSAHAGAGSSCTTRTSSTTLPTRRSPNTRAPSIYAPSPTAISTSKPQ